MTTALARATDEVALVTGYPAFTARRMILKLLEAEPRTRLLVLVREAHLAQAEALVAALAPARRRRVRLLTGDVGDMDLGLAGPEFQAVADEVTVIHHLAGSYHLGSTRRAVERANVGGTRGVLELAYECRGLRRLVHWSSAQVAGNRVGVVMEEELDCGQRFRNGYEETKFRAELLVRAAARRLPCTVVRPGIIVGDSRTGEIDRFDGPYHLLLLIVRSPVNVRLPLPGGGVAPLHLAPIDYVVDAAHLLSRHPAAAGRTFHLTDPAPLAAQAVYEVIAARAHRKGPRGAIPGGLARALLRTPGIERLARAPLALLESMDHLVFYNCRNTLELLRGTDVSCPPFEAYVDPLIRYACAARDARRAKLEDEGSDPLDR